MSTPQTDSYWENQLTAYQGFDKLLQRWFAGEVDYDDVEGALEIMAEDEEVADLTYVRCMKLWEQSKAEDDIWQSEELEKWSELAKDQGAY
jgi:hypothetical protein